MRLRGLDARRTPGAVVARALAVGLSLTALGCVLACNDTKGATPCYPGDYAACACPSGVSGYSQCDPDAGAGYRLCDCSGVIPGVIVAPSADAGEAGSTDGGGGLLGLMDSCSTNEQCASGLCFPFNAKGPKCSKTCTSANDCPPPAAGCNLQGVCKAP